LAGGVNPARPTATFSPAAMLIAGMHSITISRTEPPSCCKLTDEDENVPTRPLTLAVTGRIEPPAPSTDIAWRVWGLGLRG
jgi:hypothetical protein